MADPAFRSRRFNPWLGAALFAAPLLAGWPGLGPQGAITPDGIDYVNIARNLVHGRGFVHTIKWHYFDERPIVAPAWGQRPPMYSIFLAPIVALGGGPKAMGAANLFLLGLASLAAGGLAWRMAGAQAAAAAGLVVGLAPPMLFTASFPLTEPLFIVFVFLSLGALAFGQSAPEGKSREEAAAAAAGLVAFAAYLTRSSGTALLLAELIWLARRRAWRQAAALALAFTIPLALWSCGLKAYCGSYTYSMQKYHLVCGNFADEIGQTFGKQYPAASVFMASHARAILQTVAGHFRQYLGALFSADQLSLLTPLLGLALLAGAGGSAAGLLALYGALNVALCAVVWSTHEGVRFMLPSFAVLAPVACAGAERALRQRPWLRWTPLLAAAVVIALYAPQIASNWQGARRGRARPLRLSAAEIQWIERTIPEMTPIGTDMPFEVNFFCDRPTAWTQWTNPAFDLAAFLEKCPVGLLALTPDGAAALRASRWAGLARSIGQQAMPPLEWFVLAGP